MSFRYSKEHIWIKKTENGVLAGISDYACKQLCKSFVLNLPDEDEEFRAGDVICDIESCRYFDVVSPVKGKVLRVNEALLDDASPLLDDPYECWLFELCNVAYTAPLMSAKEYAEFLNSECGSDKDFEEI